MNDSEIQYFSTKVQENIEKLTSAIETIEQAIIHEHKELELIHVLFEATIENINYLSNSDAVVSIREYRIILEDVEKLKLAIKNHNIVLLRLQSALIEHNKQKADAEDMLVKYQELLTKGKVLTYDPKKRKNKH